MIQYLPYFYCISKPVLEGEHDGEEDEEHEEVYAEDCDDTDHCTQRIQASLSHMQCYTQWYGTYTLTPIILPTLYQAHANKTKDIYFSGKKIAIQPHLIRLYYKQGCGSVFIFYGSGSGSRA
jgi:hypothetical protein